MTPEELEAMIKLLNTPRTKYLRKLFEDDLKPHKASSANPPTATDVFYSSVEKQSDMRKAASAGKTAGGVAVAKIIATPKVEPKLQKLDPTKRTDTVQRFENRLAERIVGQPEAIQAFVAAYQTYTSGLHPAGRPVSVLLLCGPSGSGKTRIVEASAEILLGSPQAVTKIHCAEYHLPHETARLVGPPPGYLGFKEGRPVLDQENINQFGTDKCKISFVLFDEIEKANETLWQILLGVLDKGQLTMGDARKTDFSDSIIVMTSNLGAREVDSLVTGRSIGYTKPEVREKSMNDMVHAQVSKRFTPEFINRIDKTVIFNRLERDQIRQILKIELDAVQNRVFLASSIKGTPIFSLRWLPELCEFLIDAGVSPRFGARELKRVIEREIVLPLSNLVSSASISEGDTLVVGMDAGKVVFHREMIS